MILAHKDKLPVDPRTALLLLILANSVAFSQKSLFLELGLLSALYIFMVYCRCTIQAIKFMVMFGIVVFIQKFVFPYANQMIATMFAMMLVYLRKLIPCLMMGTVIIKRIPLRYLILALRKWHFPHQLIISLSVTLRYFPAIREDFAHIRDAMQLRGIKGVQKLECFIVSLIIAAASTAEELSAAAVTRGIENPIKKTSVIDIRFRLADYCFLVAGTAFVIAALWYKGADI